MSGEDLSAWDALRAWTPARIGLGRAGSSLPTGPRLRFQMDHARARDAVWAALDLDALDGALRVEGVATVRASTRVTCRQEYLLRPDLGRRLRTDSAAALGVLPQGADVAIVVGGGLSPGAVARYGPAVLGPLVRSIDGLGWSLAPVVLVEDGRVALGDEVGERLGAEMTLVLVGERPGLSAPFSLGAYITFGPRIGRTDAERNCISNIRPGGLDPAAAARSIVELLRACRAARISGVALPRTSPSRQLGPPVQD